MGTRRSVQLTSAQKAHEDVMLSVLTHIKDRGYVLKGGTALALTRNLPRHSTDLDFDAVKKIDIRKNIAAAFYDMRAVATNIKVVKNTDTVQRYKVHYINPATDGDCLLKIETSFRSPINVTEIEVINGITTYKMPPLMNQKLTAVENRTAARDLFDLSFIVAQSKFDVSEDQLRRLQALLVDIDMLAMRYKEAYEKDKCVSGTAEEKVLELTISVDFIERNMLKDEPDVRYSSGGPSFGR